MFSVVHVSNVMKFFTTRDAANTKEQEINEDVKENKNVM